MRKPKPIDQSNSTPPNGLPANFTKDGVDYVVNSVDIETNTVVIISSTGKYYEYDYNDLLFRMNIN